MKKAHVIQSMAGWLLLLIFLMMTGGSWAQTMTEQSHKRGKLWENISSDGWIGSLGAWDFLVSMPLGLYPGFKDYYHPVGNENKAVNTYANANFHNFRSGCWIVAKDLMTPGPPPKNAPTPTDYQAFLSGLQEDTYGIELPLKNLPMRTNYIESPDFDPLLPEEMTEITFHTNTGVSVTRRTYVWSFPGYSDFIIYDYLFENTGIMVSDFTSAVVPDFPQQELKDLYFVFHSGISVSTKSNINFGAELSPIHAGGFGWEKKWYHDYYHSFDDGTLVFSTNFNGGKEPPPWWDASALKENQIWKNYFGEELMSPSAFGWLALYASPRDGQPRTSPKPDVLRIDSHKGGRFQGMDLDLEKMTIGNFRPKKTFYDFAQVPDLQDKLGNTGNRFNFFTFSYGPYNLSPGQQARFILAEIAGCLDYRDVVNGDPQGHFPDSTIMAIRRNAVFARNAVKWGMGEEVNGMLLAADIPEPPPGPNCVAANVSYSTEVPLVRVAWDKAAETAVIKDASGGVFYDGSTDLDGYRIYRSSDFQFLNETEPPVFRGAYWDLILDIPRAEFAKYWNESEQQYILMDSTVVFGFRCGYYVAAYNKNPRPWTSANGTVVTDLPALQNGDYNRTNPVAASPGPVNTFDIYVVPNPYIFNDPDRSFGINDPYRIEFRSLPESCTIRIYTLSGDLISTIEHEPDRFGNLSGSAVWNQKSDSGLQVAPGLYIYHIESRVPGVNSRLTGKIMIIR